MKSIVKHISLILALVLCLGTVCACTGNGDGGDDSSDSSGQQSSDGASAADQELENTIGIIVGGASSYSIIRSQKADDDSVKQAIRLNKLFETHTGVKLKISEDWTAPGQEVDPNALEILVGNTNRTESATALEGYGNDDYTVGIYGNKIVIGARTAAALERAIDEFSDRYLNTLNPGDDLRIPKDMNFSLRHVYPKRNCSILGASLDQYRIVYPENEVYAAERTARLFASFLKKNLAVNLKVISDTKAAEDDSNAYDIVFGKTTVGGESVTTRHGWTVKATGKKLLVSSECYLGYEALYEYMTERLFLGEKVSIDEGFTASGTARTEKFEDGTEYVDNHTGDYRVMFTNILGIRDSDEATVKLRTRMIAEVALEYAADVIAVQECCPRSRGTNGYDGVLTANGYKEADVKFVNSAKNNYTPIFYRPDRLEQLESGYKIYPSTNNTKSYTWVVFKDLSNGKVFAVLGTHFKYTGGSASSSIQTGSVGLVNTAVKQITDKYKCPVMVGGDLNCTNTSEPFKAFLSLGFTDTHTLADRNEDRETEHGYPGYDSSLGIYNTGKFPSGKYSAAIDHALLYTGEGAPGNVKVHVFDVVTDDYAIKGSDHCPIFVDFDIN